MARYKVEYIFLPHFALFLWQTDVVFITRILLNLKCLSTLTIKSFIVFKVPWLAWASSPFNRVPLKMPVRKPEYVRVQVTFLLHVAIV